MLNSPILTTPLTDMTPEEFENIVASLFGLLNKFHKDYTAKHQSRSGSRSTKGRRSKRFAGSTWLRQAKGGNKCESLCVG